MGYLDQMTDTAFEEREDDTFVFFPYGALGSAYRIRQPARYRHIRRSLRGYLKTTLPAVSVVGLVLPLAALGLSGGEPVALLLAAAGLLAVLLATGLRYRRQVRRLTAGLEAVEASRDLLGALWFPTAYPRLFRMYCWGAGFTIAAVVALAYLFPDVDDRLLGLAGGGLGVTAGWAWVRGRA